MITALDTNVLYDVLQPGAEFSALSVRAVEESSSLGSLAICEIVYTELCFQFLSGNQCDSFLDVNGIDLSLLGRDACFLASRTRHKYRRQGGSRSRIVPDFLIGAHAQVHSSRLISRDSSFYRRHFPGLHVIDPAEA